MRTRLRYGALTVLAVLCASLTYGLHAYFFFARELRTEAISTSVLIGDRTYTVERGEVWHGGTRTRGMSALKALRLAYAKTLAERSPLLGLEGTDPDALRVQVSLLKDTMGAIAESQKSPEDTEMVKTALYPIDFLLSLATLESSRKQFIASGSPHDLDLYRDSLGAALRSGTNDSERLLRTFMNIFDPGSSRRVPGFAGTITATSSIDSLRSIPESFADLKWRAVERDLCLFGITWLCPSLSAPALPDVPAHKPGETDPDSKRATQAEIASLWRSVLATSTYDRLFAPVRLNTSACLAFLPPPYDLETSTFLTKNFDLLHYLNEMYFIPTAGSGGPVPRFLRDTYGLNYLKINPLVFYTCPHLLDDVSDAQATLRTAAIAKKYHDVPNSHRDTLLSGAPAEADAIAYIQEARSLLGSGSLPPSYAQEILSVSLMFDQKSAGLEGLVGQIVYIIEHDLALAESGAPFNVGAESLFFTHTATPSLFLFHQIGATSPLILSTPIDMQEFYKHFQPLSAIRSHISESALIDEMRKLNRIENK